MLGLWHNDYPGGPKGGNAVVSDCEGIGHVTCINCKGDGKLVPTMLDAAVSRDPESELDDIGMT